MVWLRGYRLSVPVPASVVSMITPVLPRSGFASFVILLVLRLTIGIRVSEAAEVEGLDLALHGETVQ